MRISNIIFFITSHATMSVAAHLSPLQKEQLHRHTPSTSTELKYFFIQRTFLSLITRSSEDTEMQKFSL